MVEHSDEEILHHPKVYGVMNDHCEYDLSISMLLIYILGILLDEYVSVFCARRVYYKAKREQKLILTVISVERTSLITSMSEERGRVKQRMIYEM